MPACAAEWYFVGASNDWWNAASYSKTASPSGNTVMPGGTDRIVTRKGQKLYFDDTTVAFLNTISCINMSTAGASLYLNLTTNAVVTCAIGDIGGHPYYDNWLIKDGEGVLSFNSTQGKEPDVGVYGSGTSKNTYRYTLSFDIRQGAIRMDPKREDVFRSYFGSVILSAGTTLYNAAGAQHDLYYGGYLSGGGTFTSENTGDANNVYFLGTDLPPSEFSGTLSGKMKVYFKHSTYLTGTDNSGVSSISSYGGYNEESENTGVLGIKTWAGSLASNEISTHNGAYCLRFLNDEDEVVTSRIQIKSSPFVIDAGARGGVSFNPSDWWGWRNSANLQQRLIFTGSNTIANVFNGPCENNQGYPSFFVTKRGSGVWRFDNENYQNSNKSITGLRGVFAVDEGTLEAVSLAEKGQRCSLGYADQLFDDVNAETNTLITLPYAIRLGSPTTGEGTLSYIGTEAKSISSRPIAVQGKGRLKAPNAPYLNWSGITGLNSGVENVFTFECAAGQTNTLSNVSGGLSIVKDGPGELRIERNIAFSGGLSVKQGSATLVNLNNAPYEYFKVTVKETAASSSNPIYDNFKITTGTAYAGRNSRSINISEFGLYDSAGKRVNAYQNGWNGDEAVDWTFETLEPGQIAPYPTQGVSVFKDAYTAWAWYATDNKVFTSTKYRWAQYHWTDGSLYAQIDKPETWLSLVQRLKGEDIGKPAMMDINLYTKQLHQPTAIEVFASADGKHWDSLFVTNNIEETESKYMWLSNGANITSNYGNSDATSHPKFQLSRTTQKPIFDFAAPSSVSVASGATLKLVGSPVIVSNLVVSAAGAGTLEGAFSFAETGTLEVKNLPEEFPVTLPGTYSGCSGFANIANWSVTCGGKAARLSVNIIDGKIVISKLGMHIIIK